MTYLANDQPAIDRSNPTHLAHAVLLTVSGDAIHELTWQPHSESLSFEVLDDSALQKIPLVNVLSAYADSHADRSADLESLATGLVNLGP